MNPKENDYTSFNIDTSKPKESTTQIIKEMKDDSTDVFRDKEDYPTKKVTFKEIKYVRQ